MSLTSSATHEVGNPSLPRSSSPPSVPEREAANPVDVGLLRLDRHVLEAQDVARGFDGLVKVHGL
jgi:hypothetical protein